MNELWALVQRHLDEWGPSQAELARRMGTNPQTISSWKSRGNKQLPKKWLLLALAEVTKTPYETVLDAALHAIDYLPAHLDAVEQAIEDNPEFDREKKDTLRAEHRRSQLEGDEQLPREEVGET